MYKLILALFLVTSISGQVSVSVEINSGSHREAPPPPPPPPAGYVNYCEDREDLVVVAPDLIGFWVRLPNGRAVLHCRQIWYDQKADVIYYGPWREDRDHIYRKTYSRYDDDYIVVTYPRYRGERFHRHHEEYRKEEHREYHHDHGRGHH